MALQNLLSPRETTTMKLPLLLVAVTVATSLAPNAFADTAKETLVVTSTEASSYPAASDSGLLAVGSSSRLELTDKERPRHTETISQKTFAAKGKRTLTEIVETAPGLSGTTSPTQSNSVSLRGFMPVSWLYDGVEVPGSTIQG
ncbi:MAG: TonB-dependent receptor plug domain-containing protein, partial [Hafnia alvei]